MAIIFPTVRLPHVNLGAKLTQDDYENSQRSIEYELLERLRLVFGRYMESGGSWGIVDEQNPTVSRSDRPLRVEVMPNNDQQFKVFAGTVVTRSGVIIDVGDVESLTLPSYGDGSVWVVSLAHKLLEGPKRLNREGTLVPQYYEYEDDTNLISVRSISDWNALSVTAQEDEVVLAIVTVSEDCTVSPVVTSLSIDMTQTAYSFNRKWFSAVDIEHRNSVGTAGSSSSVPHQLSLNDLTAAGSIGMWDSVIRVGMILSKAYTLAKTPGRLCVETITNRLLNASDVTGEVGISGAGEAESSALNFLGVSYGDETWSVPYKYAYLDGYPLDGNFVCFVDTDSDDTYDLSVFTKPASNWVQQEVDGDGNHVVIPCWVPPGSNIVVFPSTVATILDNASSIKFAYMESPALQPPGGVASALSTSLTFGSPLADQEAIVADGALLETVSNAVVDFSNAGPIPSFYKVYAKKVASSAAAEVFRSPQTLQARTLLSGISGTQSIGTQPLGEAYLRVGLAFGSLAALPPSTFQVEVQITGKDSAGNALSESVFFIGSGVATPSGNYVYYRWDGENCDNETCLVRPANFGSDSSPWYVGNAHVYAWVRTANKYAEVTNYSLPSSPVDVQPEATLVVEALLDPMDTTMMRRVCPVADVSWNGAKVCQIRDVRPVSYKADLPATRQAKLANSAQNAVFEFTHIQNVLDFDQPGAQPLCIESLDDLRNADPLHTFMPQESDGHTGIKVNSFPMFGNSLPIPDATTSGNFPPPYFYEPNSCVWVSKPLPVPDNGFFKHRSLAISLLRGRRNNNQFSNYVLGGVLGGGSVSTDEVWVRFLVFDTSEATTGMKWTKWRPALQIGSQNYTASVNTGDSPSGSEYVFWGAQILVKDTRRYSGIIAWSTKLGTEKSGTAA